MPQLRYMYGNGAVTNPCIRFGQYPASLRKNLEKENVEGPSKQVFNMELVDKEFSVVTVGAVKGESVAMTTMVTVPMMVNSRDVKQGEELILEIAAVAAANHKRKCDSWKDEETRKAQATKNGKEACAKKAGMMEI